MPPVYEQLLDRVRDLGRMQSIAALLDWDQETQMPRRGVTARAEELALVAGLAHDRLVADETRSLLDAARGDADDFVAEANLREIRRAFDREVRVPTDLVKEIAHTSSLAKDTWATARERSAFAEFAPLLGKMVDLKKQVADCIGYETQPYDALMDEFEPGALAADVENLFRLLGDETVALLKRIQGAPKKPDRSILERVYPVDKQATLSRRMAEALGFDFERGRSDVSVHPFCTTIGGADDVRITTRYQQRFLPTALFGTMHETGHALYEQGLPDAHRFTPMAEAVSLGIHESQSRLWENMVGRSRAFWQHHWPALRDLFSESLGDVSLDAFYAAINAVEPSLIRVEADELTYNLHIIARFRIERALFSGELTVNDVPAAWNDAMSSLLGVKPPDDRLGCLQDVHWSMGAFGYFPTYALGNLYAAQFFAQAKRDIPDLTDRIAAGDYSSLLGWLRKNIHGHGRRYRAGELVQRVTGEALSIRPFVAYLTEKFGALYGL